MTLFPLYYSLCDAVVQIRAALRGHADGPRHALTPIAEGFRGRRPMMMPGIAPPIGF